MNCMGCREGTNSMRGEGGKLSCCSGRGIVLDWRDGTINEQAVATTRSSKHHTYMSRYLSGGRFVWVLWLCLLGMFNIPPYLFDACPVVLVEKTTAYQHWLLSRLAAAGLLEISSTSYLRQDLFGQRSTARATNESVCYENALARGRTMSHLRQKLVVTSAQ